MTKGQILKNNLNVIESLKEISVLPVSLVIVSVSKKSGKKNNNLNKN